MNPIDNEHSYKSPYGSTAWEVDVESYKSVNEMFLRAVIAECDTPHLVQQDQVCTTANALLHT